jgi:hypothetical protein
MGKEVFLFYNKAGQGDSQLVRGLKKTGADLVFLVNKPLPV